MTVSEIQNPWLRRTTLIVTLPFILIGSLALAIGFAILETIGSVLEAATAAWRGRSNAELPAATNRYP